jgi:hypothetical protein
VEKAIFFRFIVKWKWGSRNIEIDEWKRRRNMRPIGLSAFLYFALAACAHGDTIALWNFNDAISSTTGGVQEFSVDRGVGIMASDFTPSSISNSAGTTLNSESGDPAGQALRLSGNANNGNSLTWMVDTTDFDSILVSFAIQRTSTGFSDNQFLYSIDSGASWTAFGNSFAPGTSFALQSFDLSGIQGLNNNPDVVFRIVFGGATSGTGNNRIDNLQVTGNPIIPPLTEIPEPSTIALVTAGLACVFAIKRKRSPL